MNKGKIGDNKILYLNKADFESIITDYYLKDKSFFLLNIEVCNPFSSRNFQNAEALLIVKLVSIFGEEKVNIYKTKAGRFKMALSDLKANEIKKDLKELINSFKVPVKTNDGYIFINIKIGVVYSTTKESLQKLVLRSRLALMYSKENEFSVYHKNMYKRYYVDLKLEELLYEAYTQNEFEPFFQAYIDANTQEVVGAEVLMRWIKSQEKIIPPILFIPILEKNKFIIEVELKFIRKIFTIYNVWKSKYNKEFPLSINISAVQLSNLKFIDEIEEIVKEYKISPGILSFEITESYVIENVASAAATLERLKLLGFNISLDDFGTGYSTLTHLKSLPIDILKIDMVFIRNITKDKKSEIIVAQMIEMAKKLNLKVICEGVETEEQYLKLRELGADIIQGYYFSTPIPKSQFEQKYLVNIDD